MKVLFGILLLSASLAAAGAFPEMDFYDLNDQKTATLSDLKGNVVILNFWASWCGPCRMELPILQKIAKARAKENVKIIAVNLDGKSSKAKSFIEKTGLELTVYRVKPEVVRSMGVNAVPVTVVLDKSGRVAVTWAGMSLDMEKDLNALIEDLSRR